MVRTVLSTVVLLISALLIIETISQVLVARATTVPATEGRLIKPQQPQHWVDRPEVGVIV